MKKKENPPAFQFYVKDFLLGTITMSNAETGAYIKLLCHQWDLGELPDDKNILIKLCNGDKTGIDAAIDKFINKNGKLKNKKLEKVRKQNQNYRKIQSENGKKGAKARHAKHSTGAGLDGTAKATPKPKVSSATATASSTASSNKKLASSDVEKLEQEAQTIDFKPPIIPPPKINSKKAFEFFRMASLPQITDDQIWTAISEMEEKYEGQKIRDLKSLCESWAANLKPQAQKNKFSFV